MNDAIKRYISKKTQDMIMMPPLKREAFRLIICCALAFILNVILYTGIETDGTVKGWAEGPLQLLASTTMLLFMIKFFLPVLGWTILKAVLLSANNTFSGILSFLANQFTGAMYCAGLVLGSITLKQYLLSKSLDAEMATLSAFMFLAGFIYFYLFQCAIQKTPLPALLNQPMRRR